MILFFNDTATTEIYTLSLHDALPICRHYVTGCPGAQGQGRPGRGASPDLHGRGPMSTAARASGDAREVGRESCLGAKELLDREDRKSTRLNSSHANISYAVFCLKKKN